MNDLIEYINDNISQVNKNNHIHIVLGKNISENIFNSRLDHSYINTFLKKINKYDKNTKLEHFKMYKHKNSITMINNKQNIHYSYIIDNSKKICLDRISVYANIYKVLAYNDLGMSIYNYDYIQDIQLYQISIDNLFIIEVLNTLDNDLNKEYFTIHFIIKKPNQDNKLLKKLKEILNLL